MFVLINRERQEAIAKRVAEFLSKKYGPIRREERYLTASQVGKLRYLPVGIEEERGFMHKVFDIIESHRRRNYNTPILVVEHRSRVVVDGYARAVAAFLLKVAWPAIVLKPKARPSFFAIAKADIAGLYRKRMNTIFLEWGERVREA